MRYLFSQDELDALPHIVSAPRFATYLRVTHGVAADALALYQWNAEVSAAFLLPLQICEIAIRNAASRAIEDAHGPLWPWRRGFVRSLPTSPSYDPKKDLIAVASRQATVGKVVADLRFMFWQKMFTARHDERIWAASLRTYFPNMPTGDVSAQRQLIHDQVDRVRTFRNRIAHHEPIFARPLQEEYDRIIELVGWRCKTTAEWLHRCQDVHRLIAARP